MTLLAGAAPVSKVFLHDRMSRQTQVTLEVPNLFPTVVRMSLIGLARHWWALDLVAAVAIAQSVARR